MNYQELQDRANVIVQRVNSYEASLPEETVDEETALNEHTYCDIHCLRAVFDWITGCDSTRKANTTLENKINGQVIGLRSITNSVVHEGCFDHGLYKYNFRTQTFSNLVFNNTEGTSSFLVSSKAIDEGPVHNFGAKKYNLWYYACQYGGDFSWGDTTFNIGAKNMTGGLIADCLITECQVANLTNTYHNFFENLSLTNIENDANSSSIYNSPALSPSGIHYYFSGNNSYYPYPTIQYNFNQNHAGREILGAPLIIYDYSENNDLINYTQRINIRPDGGFIQECKLYSLLNTYYSRSYASPQKIHYNNIIFGNSYNRSFMTSSGKVNYKMVANPIQSCYFELVFKRRREGCKAADLDFIPSIDTVWDNDPQGLATRLALAQCKPNYRGRPWFEELDEYYTENGTYQKKLADVIVEATSSMNDTTFMSSYKLNYETFANVMEYPL